jgi:hypothetical protein
MSEHTINQAINQSSTSSQHYHSTVLVETLSLSLSLSLSLGFANIFSPPFMCIWVANADQAYHFAKFNKKVKVIQYNDEEYDDLCDGSRMIGLIRLIEILAQICLLDICLQFPVLFGNWRISHFKRMSIFFPFYCETLEQMYRGRGRRRTIYLTFVAALTSDSSLLLTVTTLMAKPVHWR